MSRDEFIESRIRTISPDMLHRKGLLHVMYGAIYDELHPQETLRVLRNERAKQFNLISVAKDGDVGFDLPAVFENDYDEVMIWPGDRGVVPTGIKLEIPKGYWASIEARSSTSKYGLIVPKGVIDEGYRGELFAVLLNVGHDKVRIKHGDRFVQLIMHKRCNSNITITEVDELAPSERGDSGFGSTGQKASTSGG